jgi:GMP synthase-like glutamine amidotransferase
MRVLSMTHGPLVRGEIFDDVVTAAGHELEEWSLVDADAPPRPIDEYDAVFVFGGKQNVGEERAYPWLVPEYDVLRDLVERRVPLFGVCLGVQLLARAMGADVGPSPEPERGFVPVELTDAARSDPIFSGLPERFEAFQGHLYAFEVPDGSVELARSRVCSQAIRVGECAWGVQFHPEVRVPQIEQWYAKEEAATLPETERVVAEARARFGEWNAFGARLCRAFLTVAERFAAVR